jgi:hypothetical protein
MRDEDEDVDEDEGDEDEDEDEDEDGDEDGDEDEDEGPGFEPVTTMKSPTDTVISGQLRTGGCCVSAMGPGDRAIVQRDQ